MKARATNELETEKANLAGWSSWREEGGWRSGGGTNIFKWASRRCHQAFKVVLASRRRVTLVPL